MKHALPVLHASPWGSALTYRGIDVGEVLFSPFYEVLMRCVRSGERQVVAQKKDAFLLSVRRRLRRIGQDRQAKRYSVALLPARILFWPRLPSHVRQQVPVARVLGKLDIEYRFVACQARIAEALRMQGFFVTYAHAEWAALAAEAQALAAQRATAFKADPGRLPVLSAGVAQQIIMAQLRRCLQQQLAPAYEAIAFAQAMLQTAEPSVLVVGNDITIEGRAGVLTARKQGIQTATLMHGTVAGHAHHRVHLVDCMLTFGTADRAFFLSMGMLPERVQVCGAPYLDERPRQTGKLHPDVRRFLGSRAGDPCVLVATSGPGFSISHAHHIQTIEHVMRLSALLPEVTFIAKLHPKDRLSYYQQAKAQVPDSRLRMVPHGTRGVPTDIFDWLQGCNIVLTGASTVAREALLMDVPVVTMDFANEVHGIDFIDAEATLHVTSPEALEASVRSLVADGPPKEMKARVLNFLENSFHKLDGQASRRCAEALLALAETSATPAS